MIVRVTDDRRRELTFTEAPKRVVSLVPSDTWSVAALGCAGAIVGRTDYCELPADVVARLPSVGGTKNARVESILDLSPDLVIANQEENTKRDLETLAQRGVKILLAFPKRAADGLAHVARLAKVFRVESDANVRAMLKKGYEEVRAAEQALAGKEPVPTFCPIWMKPLMTINGETFISDMLALGGARNVFADRQRRYPLAADILPPTRPQTGATRAPSLEAEGRDTRYPRVTMDEVRARRPELVLLPDEPHPFTEEDAQVFRDAGFARVVKTSGKDLCWYGAWTVDALPRVRALVTSS